MNTRDSIEMELKEMHRSQLDTHSNTINPTWLNLGLGGSTAGISGGISLNINSGNDIYTFRYAANSSFDLFSSPDETVWDVGFLYGICSKSSYGVASISCGISIVSGVRRGKFLRNNGWFSSEYESLDFTTVGFPFEAQLLWTPSSFFGIGLSAFGNYNKEKSFTGLLLCLQFGALK